jgi:HK97 family phage major capsid protein/HK97 family phage prohead protease
MDRAYSVLEIKSIAGDRRRIVGLASTPTPDRRGDILEPLGATFSNPLPLLLHHDIARPVGRVTLTATRDGIAFDAELPAIAEAGAVRDRVDEAWQSIKAGLIRGVSIGFRPLADGVKYLKSGGSHILRSEICEVSLVTIPMNAEATITAIKSIDSVHLAASGRTLPASRDVVKVRPMAKQTAGEHIQNLENKRAALTARMAEIMGGAADEGETTDPAQAAEHDGLSVQVKAIDGDLGRWRELEKIQEASAVPVIVKAAMPFARVSVRPNVVPGTAFVRLACAMLACHGNKQEAAIHAARWDDSTPEVALALKAAIAPGTSTDAVWAGPLVNQNIANEFLELLRPATILGKIPNLREVPLNTKVPAQTAGGTYGWVGEAKPKPVTKLAFATESLGVAKAAGIIVLTEELVRLSNPKAEEICRKDMIAGIAQFLDQQFIDPAVAAVAGVNPASITNGAPTAAASGAPLADILGLINHFATNNISVDGLVFILNAANALALSFRNNADGSPQFPGITVSGGSFKGITFIASNAATTNVIALQPQLILFADDGGVTIDASREASLQMDSAPASPADATTVYVSLWQTNCVGLRAERFVNWKRVGTNSVKYLTAANWPAPSGVEEPPATQSARSK